MIPRRESAQKASCVPCPVSAYSSIRDGNRTMTWSHSHFHSKLRASKPRSHSISSTRHPSDLQGIATGRLLAGVFVRSAATAAAAHRSRMDLHTAPLEARG
jgi:hypothetical protein